MKKLRIICIVLCAVLAAGALITWTAADTRANAAETAAEAPVAAENEEGKTLPSELEQFIADWGEPSEGIAGQTEYVIDFEDYDVDTDFSQLEDLLEDWLINNATGDYITKVVADKDGNKYLEFAPFGQMYLSEGITNKYVFSCDVKAPANQGFGIFIRSTGETGINPYFEDDQSGHDIMGIGPSGVYVIPNEKSIKIYVKYYDERKSSDAGKKYLNNKVVTIKSPDSFSSDFQKLTFVDYGSGAKIFINGALAATLEFSDIVDGYDELLSECKYYSHVLVYDNTGKQKAEIKDALVCADYSVLAIGMRINSAEVDNIAITQYENKIESSEVDPASKADYLVGDNYASNINLIVKYDTGATKKVALDAEALEGFDTSAAGDKTVKISYKGLETEFTIHVSEPPEPTEAPQATDAAKPTDAPKTTDNSGSEDDTKQSDSNKKALTVGLIVGGVLIVAIAVAAVILSQKKKKG